MDSSTIKHLLNNEADTNAQRIGFRLLNEFSLLAFDDASVHWAHVLRHLLVPNLGSDPRSPDGRR